MEVKLNLTYTKAQHEIYFQTAQRFRVVPKGRRLGLTRGGSQAFIEDMLEYPAAYMWGDTVLANIKKYIERYWMPVLKQLPRSMWEWAKSTNTMYIADSVCDFRSADHPENWEGFGYRKIFLNEAGIILENEYLWENAVQPMLLDNPESICIIGGTPKGENLFHRLAQRGYSAAYPDWITLEYSTLDNPFLEEDEILRMAADMDEATMEQEIFGKFIGQSERQLISGTLVDEAMDNTLPQDTYAFAPVIVGVDVAREGDDQTVIAIRQGLKVYPLLKYRQLRTNETSAIVANIIRTHQPKVRMVFVDGTGGYGAGVVDDLIRLGYGEYVQGIHFAERASEPHLYCNIRYEMWQRTRDWLPNADLPRDGGLRSALTGPRYGWDDKDRLKLEKKEATKKRLGKSPDEGDALALTHARPVMAEASAIDLIPEPVGDY